MMRLKTARRGGLGMSDVTHLSGILGLSFQSPFIFHVLFFGLVLLLVLSCHFFLLMLKKNLFYV